MLFFSSCIKFKNTKLPFFSYGVFKPGQLGYHNIEECVDTVEDAKCEFKLMAINGIPVLINEKMENTFSKGCILSFKKNKQKEAYKCIGESKRVDMYCWREIVINSQKVNVLMGVRPEIVKSCANRNLISYDWGRDDFTFLNNFRFVERELKEFKKKSQSTNGIRWSNNDFIKIQMYYMLLWSSIDRFTTLRYGFSVTKNILCLAKEKCFKEALMEAPCKTYSVFSVENLRSYELNPHKPACSMLYYYTLRNNTVHGGKTIEDNAQKLYDALIDLTLIFRYVIDNLIQ